MLWLISKTISNIGQKTINIEQFEADLTRSHDTRKNVQEHIRKELL